VRSGPLARREHRREIVGHIDADPTRLNLAARAIHVICRLTDSVALEPEIDRHFAGGHVAEAGGRRSADDLALERVVSALGGIILLHLLDRAVRRLLEQELLRIGAADVGHRDHHGRQHRQEQSHLDYGCAALVARELAEGPPHSTNLTFLPWNASAPESAGHVFEMSRLPE